MQRNSLVNLIRVEGLIQEQEIIENPNFIFALDGFNTSPLGFYLGYNGEEKIYEKEAKALLQRGGRANTLCGNNLFRYLFRTGNVEMIEELLSYGALINRDRNILGTCLEYFIKMENFLNRDINRIKVSWQLLLSRPSLIKLSYKNGSGLTALDLAFSIPLEFREILLSPLIDVIKIQYLQAIKNGRIKDQTDLNKFLSAMYTFSDKEKVDIITQRIKAPIEQWLNSKDSENRIADTNLSAEVKAQTSLHDAMSEDEIKKILEEAVNQSPLYFTQYILNSKEIRDYESKTLYTLKLALRKNDVTLVELLWQTVGYPKIELVMQVIFNLDNYSNFSLIPNIISMIFSRLSPRDFDLLQYLIKFYEVVDKREKESKEQNINVLQKIKVVLTPVIRQHAAFNARILIVKDSSNNISSYSMAARKNDTKKIYDVMVHEKISPELTEIIQQSCTTAIINALIAQYPDKYSLFIKDFTLPEIRNYVENCFIESFWYAINKRREESSNVLRLAGRVMFHFFKYHPISYIYGLILSNIFQKECKLTQSNFSKIISIVWRVETAFLGDSLAQLRTSFVNTAIVEMEKILSTPLLTQELNSYKDQIIHCFNMPKNINFELTYFYLKQSELILKLIKKHEPHITGAINLAGWCREVIQNIKHSPSLSEEYTSKLLAIAFDQCQYFREQYQKHTIVEADAKQSLSEINATLNHQNETLKNLIEFWFSLVKFYQTKKNDKVSLKVACEGINFFMKTSINVVEYDHLLKNISDIFSSNKTLKLNFITATLTNFIRFKIKNPKLEYRLYIFLAQSHFELGHFEEAHKASKRAINIEIPHSSDKTAANTMPDLIKQDDVKPLPHPSSETVMSNKSASPISPDAKLQEPNKSESIAPIDATIHSAIPFPSPVDITLQRSIKNGMEKLTSGIAQAKIIFDNLTKHKFIGISESQKIEIQQLYLSCNKEWEKIKTENDPKNPTPQFNSQVYALHDKITTLCKRAEVWTVTTPSVQVYPSQSSGIKKTPRKKVAETSSSGVRMFQRSDKKNNRTKSTNSGNKPNKSGKNKSTNTANSRVKITLDNSIYNRRYLTDLERQRTVEQAREQCRPWPLMTNEPRTKSNVTLTAGHGVVPEPSPNSSQSLSSSTLSSSSVVPQSLFNPGLTDMTPSEENSQSKSAVDEQQQPIVTFESGSLAAVNRT